MASDARGYICKICDFGLARVLTSSSAATAGGGGKPASSSASSSSRSGSLPISLSFAAAVASAAAAHPAFTHVSTHTHGTLAYQAPEVISQGRVGRPADVFSLAVLSAEVFSGWKPFRALPLGAVVHAIVYSHERQGRGREKQREKEERKEKKTHFLKNSKLKQNSKLGNTGRPCLLGARQSSRTSSAAAGPRNLPRGRGLPPSWPL